MEVRVGSIWKWMCIEVHNVCSVCVCWTNVINSQEGGGGEAQIKAEFYLTFVAIIPTRYFRPGNLDLGCGKYTN